MTGLRTIRTVREHGPMQGGGPRVTIVGHDASNSGAPAVLASLLRWRASLDRPADGGIEVVLLAGGPGVAELAGLVPVRCRPGGIAGGVPAALEVGARGLVSVGTPPAAVEAFGRLQTLVTRRLLGGGAGDIVVANTLVALPAAAAIAGTVHRLVCHVHELDGVAERVLPSGPDRDRLVRRVDRFLAAGPQVATMLTDRWRIAPRLVTVIDEFVDDRPPLDSQAANEARSLISQHADRPVVVSVGRAGPRKGTDLFVGLMAVLAGHPARPTGAWIGGDPADAAWSESAHDIEAAGLGGRVVMVPDIDDARGPMAAADVVVSTAREDPYPLAMIEAAVAGRPVVAFASGGVIDMLEDAGLGDHLVAAGDVAAMAAVVGQLLDDPDRSQESGARLAAWARTTHLTQHWAPRWWDAVLDPAGTAP